jgi:hypothetical protein
MFTLPVAVIITIVCWVTVYVLAPDLPGKETTYVFLDLPDISLVPLWINKLICLGIYFIIGYLLIQMNNAFGLIRVRVSIQTAIFLLLISACPSMQQFGPEDIATLLFVMALYLLLSTYQHPRPSGYLFHIFLLIGSGSLIFPQITLLAPVLLIGAFNFYALNLRSLFAALIGWFLPYWFLYGHAFYYGDMELFHRPLIELMTFRPTDDFDFSVFTSEEITILRYSIALFTVGSLHFLAKSYKDTIRTRKYLRFFILLNICIYALIALQPALCTSLLPLSLVGVSILTGHLFVLTGNRMSNIFFICSIIGLILLFYFNLWTFL